MIPHFEIYEPSTTTTENALSFAQNEVIDVEAEKIASASAPSSISELWNNLNTFERIIMVQTGVQLITLFICFSMAIKLAKR